MTLAETIRAAREESGMTQASLAFEVGVKRSTIVRWESGRTRPRNHNLLRLCQVLGLNPEDFTQ